MGEQAHDIQTKNLTDYRNYFNELWGEGKPIIKLFRTNQYGYLYDTGTNRLVKCTDMVFSILNELMCYDLDNAIRSVKTKFNENELIISLEQIVSTIEKANILKIKREKIKFIKRDQKYYEDLCNNSLSMVVLEITENCNLRCEYCVFGDELKSSRNHSKNFMNLDMVFKSIDYLNEHSASRDEVSITFYGGEPLLRFNAIKKCVGYAKNTIKNKKINFSLTTNGTLITNEIAKYLFEKNFSLLVSIDGPEEVHNDYRKKINKQGSFSESIRGLEILINVMGESAKKMLSLSMVYTPPYSANKLNRILQLWELYPWLKNIFARITYPHPNSIPSYKFNFKNYSEDKSLLDWAYEIFARHYIAKTDAPEFIKQIIITNLIMIFRRPQYDYPIEEIHLNGCCIPGQRKVFISTNGDIYTCERIHKNAPSLGTLEKGINIEKLKEVFVDDYAERSIEDCSKCWCNRLCGSCYMDAFEDGKFNIVKKRERCRSILQSTYRGLLYYAYLLELNSEGLNFLSEIEIS